MSALPGMERGYFARHGAGLLLGLRERGRTGHPGPPALGAGLLLSGAELFQGRSSWLGAGG